MDCSCSGWHRRSGARHAKKSPEIAVARCICNGARATVIVNRNCHCPISIVRCFLPEPDKTRHPRLTASILAEFAVYMVMAFCLVPSAHLSAKDTEPTWIEVHGQHFV